MQEVGRHFTVTADTTAWEPIAAMLTSQRQVMEENVLAATTLAAVLSVGVGYRV